MTYQICSRCLMDSTDPEIQFTDAGCQHCEQFLSIKMRLPTGKARDDACDRLVGDIKKAGKGKQYDCIMGVSGGTDSTFVAYTAKQLGLRPLAVHLDNGWDSELAVMNIENTLEKLGIDLFTNVLDWNEFKSIQLGFLYASTPDLELPTDHAIRATLLNAAVKYKVRYIISGRNYSTEGILPTSWSYGPLDYKYIKAVHKEFIGGRIRNFTRLTLMRYLWITIAHRRRDIGILNYVDYNKSAAVTTLKNELGWRDYGDKHYESVWTRFYQGHILPVKFGYDKRRAHLSVLVLNKEISREHGLEILAENEYQTGQAKEDKQYVLKKFGLTDSDFDAIMNTSPKTYRDYPNHSKIFLPGEGSFSMNALKVLRKIGVLPPTLTANAVSLGGGSGYGEG